MKPYSFPIAVSFLILFPFLLFAQSEMDNQKILSSEAPNLRFENLSLEDGMAQYSAQSIIQDSLGYIWVSTQGGLHRYNGYDFKIYNSAPFDSTSLSDNFTTVIEESSDGNIWVGTNNGGLNLFHRKSQSFTKYQHDPNDSTSISSGSIFDVYEASNGDLWVASSSAGVSRLPGGKGDKFIRYQHEPEQPNSLSSNFIYRITEDENGGIWIGSRAGINLIQPSTGNITRYLNDISDDGMVQEGFQIRDQYHSKIDPEIIWLASDNGLIRLNTSSGSYKRFLPPAQNISNNLDRARE